MSIQGGVSKANFGVRWLDTALLERGLTRSRRSVDARIHVNKLLQTAVVSSCFRSWK
jgi:hypothetical protein